MMLLIVIRILVDDFWTHVMNGARKERRCPAQAFNQLGKAQIANLDVSLLSNKYVSNNRDESFS
jgi:hypothetical protein